jgi:hypothetical protein
MRRTMLAVAGAALLGLIAVTAWSAPAAANTFLYFYPPPDQQHRAPIEGGDPGKPGRTWGYWGKLAGVMGTTRSGNYRATCSWLADSDWGDRPKQRDSRMLCTVLFSFRALPAPSYVRNGGGLVAQGLVRRPPGKETLFAHPSTRKLAITGGTGPYSGARGYADFADAPASIKITLLP